MRNPITGIDGCCARGLTLAASNRPPGGDQCDELTLHVRHGDFLPYAVSAPPTGPWARFSGTISLPQRGRLVLGVELNCSESRR